MNKREVLAGTTFGQRIAEDEADVLESYFVETDQWAKVFSGSVDVIYGPKGSGKSALYSVLRKKVRALNDRGIIPAAGENVRGTPVFEDLVADPPASEEQFRDLWKMYFLVMMGTALRVMKMEDEETNAALAALEKEGLLCAEWSLKRMLRSALDYVRRLDSVSADIKVSEVTGQPEGVGGKITFREPSSEQRSRGYTTADDIFRIADRALSKAGKKFWIILESVGCGFH